MGTALDCTSSPDNAAILAYGATGVCRYLSWLPNSKVIAATEYQRLLSGGVDVLLNWEYDARDWMTGASGGFDHATEAVRQARALGYPNGRAIAGSCDFDLTAADWSNAAHAYAVQFATVIRNAGYQAGVYGPWNALQWAQQTGLYTMFWQAGRATSWSGGQNAQRWPAAHLFQRTGVTVGGHDCDANDILKPDYGQAHAGQATESITGEDDMPFGELPAGFAIDEHDQWLDVSNAVAVPLPAVGGGAGQWGSAWLWIASTDPITVRVGCFPANQWFNVDSNLLVTGGPAGLPAGTTNVLLCRKRHAADDVADSGRVRWHIQYA